MGGGVSEVRAAYCKGAISAAKRHAQAELLLDAIAPARAAIRSAGMLAWVELEHFMTLAEATQQVLGWSGAREFWAERLLDAFGRPLMRPLVAGGLRLFGHTPGSLVRMTPQAYRLTFRKCGSPEVSAGEDHVELRISELPESMRRPSIVSCYYGHCRATVRHVGGAADVAVDDAGLLDQGSLRLVVSW